MLELQDVEKHFGGVHAVAGVSLQVRKGEVVALVGNNGAGKSTIIHMSSGVYPPDSGTVMVSGRAVRMRSARDARDLGIELVPQELALAKHLSATANIFLGREMTRRFGPVRLLDKRSMRKRGAELIEGFGIHIPSLAARVFDMSGGQQQGVAIARALAWGSQMVLLDEPTAALGIEETARVEQTIRQMRANNVAILLVSHNLDQVFRVSDRIYVLRRGRIEGHVKTNETNESDVVALITGVAVSNSPLGRAPTIESVLS
ncbi:MAG: ATP-binding cassette domain-containing protein [Acidimicrobiales bacterium]